MSSVQTSRIVLPDGRDIKLTYDTDAATLHWILQSNLVSSGTKDYEFLRRIVAKRFNQTLGEFLEYQHGLEIPDLGTKEYLENLPDEAYNKLLWAHPLFWVIHNWIDSGTELRPYVQEKPFLKHDLDAAVYIRIKKRNLLENKVNSWIHRNFHLTPEAFDELFVKTRLLHDFNYFSRAGSESLVCRIRQDIKQLIIEQETWITKAEAALIQNNADMTNINRVLRNSELAALISQSDRTLKLWQQLKMTQPLRVRRRRTKTGRKMAAII
jgi:hypothetical protein